MSRKLDKIKSHAKQALWARAGEWDLSYQHLTLVSVLPLTLVSSTALPFSALKSSIKLMYFQQVYVMLLKLRKLEGVTSNQKYA